MFALITKNLNLSKIILTYQINTLRKGALEVLRYLYNFSDIFNLKKALEPLNLGGVKHSININETIPYSPLYNLLEA